MYSLFATSLPYPANLYLFLKNINLSIYYLVHCMNNTAPRSAITKQNVWCIFCVGVYFLWIELKYCNTLTCTNKAKWTLNNQMVILIDQALNIKFKVTILQQCVLACFAPGPFVPSATTITGISIDEICARTTIFTWAIRTIVDIYNNKEDFLRFNSAMWIILK